MSNETKKYQFIDWDKVDVDDFLDAWGVARDREAEENRAILRRIRNERDRKRYANDPDARYKARKKKERYMYRLVNGQVNYKGKYTELRPDKEDLELLEALKANAEKNKKSSEE